MPQRTDDLDHRPQQSVARSHRGGAKAGRGGPVKGHGDSSRKGAAIGRGAHGDAAVDEQKERRSRTRDEIYKGISIVASENPTLSKSDFDGHVLQYLHAIHGVGGLETVNRALVLIHESTVNKTRSQIGNWPAYLATLLKKYHADARETARLAAGSSGTKITAHSGGDAAAGKLSVDEPVAATNVVAVPPEHGDESIKSCRRTLSSTLEVPTGVRGGQLMNAADGQFICRICLDLCEEPAVLPCSHLFCRECLKQLMHWSADKVNVKFSNSSRPVHCPACRAPITNTQEVPEEQAIARQLIGRIQICCAFADPSRLPDRDDDPLPDGHAARAHRLRCDWVGTVAAYAAHLELNCEVACRLREMQSGVDASGAVALPPQPSPHCAAGGSANCRIASGPQQPWQPQLGSLVPPQEGEQWQPGSALFGGFAALSGSEVVARRSNSEKTGLPPVSATSAIGRGIRVVGCPGSASAPTAATQPPVIDEVSSGAARPRAEASAHAPAPRAVERTVIDGMAGMVGVFVTSTAYMPQEAMDGQQLALEVGDRVAVYQHEKRGWAYGAKLRDDGALAGPRGWFPSWAVEVD